MLEKTDDLMTKYELSSVTEPKREQFEKRKAEHERKKAAEKAAVRSPRKRRSPERRPQGERRNPSPPGNLAIGVVFLVTSLVSQSGPVSRSGLVQL